MQDTCQRPGWPLQPGCGLDPLLPARWHQSQCPLRRWLPCPWHLPVPTCIETSLMWLHTSLCGPLPDCTAAGSCVHCESMHVARLAIAKHAHNWKRTLQGPCCGSVPCSCCCGQVHDQRVFRGRDSNCDWICAEDCLSAPVRSHILRRLAHGHAYEALTCNALHPVPASHHISHIELL